MTPGRDFDLLLAREVVRLDPDRIERGLQEGTGTLYSRVMIPEYSSDKFAVWDVVDALYDRFTSVEIIRDGGAWECVVWTHPERPASAQVRAVSDISVAHAVGKAALEAFGVEYDSD